MMTKIKDNSLPLENNGVAKFDSRTERIARRWSPLFLIPIVLLTLFSGAVIGMYFQPPGLRAFFNVTGLKPGAGTDTPIAVAKQQIVEKEQIAVISEGDVVALGRIIPIGDVISVATPSGAGDARIAELKIKVGDIVQANVVLAVLDNLPLLQSAVISAQANFQLSEANLSQTRTLNAISRAEAQASLDRVEATTIAAQAELIRATSLFERGFVSRAKLDQVTAQSNESIRDVEKAKATLSRYTNGSQSVQVDIAVAQANLEAARADLARSEQELESAYVRAPQSGAILDINALIGERPSSDGFINLGDISQMTVEAEVYQTMVGRVTIGDPVKVIADPLGRELTGVVSAIGLEIGRQSITSDDTAANTDARVVDVIIMLDEASSKIASRFTNLEAIVRIDASRVE